MNDLGTPTNGREKERSAPPRISVVLPTYNQRAYLERAVASVLAQTFKDFELIVVDDGSSDGTGDYLDGLRDPRLKVIHQKNARLPRALNRGFAEARGDYLTWVSSDNVSAPFMLEALVLALDAHPAAVLAVGAFAWIDEKDRIRRVTRDQDVTRRGFLARNPGVAAFAYRRTTAAVVGDYDPELEGSEDWDYWQRLLVHGPAVRIPEVLYYYREHAASMTRTIPERIRRTSVVAFQRALGRLESGREIDILYPEVSRSSDRDAAIYEASIDLGIRFLGSPFVEPERAAAMFMRALAQRPRDPVASLDLAVAYARSGRFDAVADLARDLRLSRAADAVAVCDLLERGLGRSREALAAESLLTRPKPSPGGIGERTQVLEWSHAAYALGRVIRTPEANRSGSEPISFVIITGGKRPDSVAAVVRSIRAQRVPDVEILLVGRPSDLPGVVPVRLEAAADSGRLGEMRNAGAARSRHDRIAFLDDDILLAPGWYEAMNAADAAADVLTADTRLPDGTRYWGHATCGGPRGHVLLDPSEADSHLYMSGGCGWLLRRRVVRAVQWCAERGFYKEEDVDFAARVRAAGFTIAAAPGAVVFHDDPVYTQIGRMVMRRHGQRGPGWVAAFEHASPAEVIAALDREIEAEHDGDAVDLIRYGARRWPEMALFADLERTAAETRSGMLPESQWFPAGDPIYNRLKQTIG